MQITRDGELYKAVRVTGPHHNMLGLVLSPGPVEETEVEQLGPRANADQSGRLDPGQVLARVLEGVGEANRALDTQYGVVRVQFDPTDTPPLAAYILLARRIVEAVVQERS